MGSKKYYKNLDFLRCFLCIAVLLYHLDILKGGYLAVGAFFTLSGYLSVYTLLSKEKFSFKEYYLNKIKRLYLPVLIVTLISVAVINIFKDIVWINLKPETLSVIGGYNNYWQLSANLDYFTRHISSPFMHFWYIAILLQIDLVFPFVFLFLKKAGEKLKIIPIIISLLITLASAYYFVINVINGNLMVAYYSSFARLFSFTIGMFKAFIDNYYNNKFTDSNFLSVFSKVIYYSLFIILFVCGKSDSSYFYLLMILSSLITLRIINYSMNASDNLNVFDKVIKFIASISYEIYLIQYPAYFILKELGFSKYNLIIGTITITIIMSAIISRAFKSKRIYIKCILLTILTIISLYGLYIFCISKDHSKEMANLEKELALNEKILKENQEKYLNNFNQENISWEKQLKAFEDGKASIKELVDNLHIVGIGDSVMLGAVSELYETFPNGYFDAAISRSAWVITTVIDDLNRKNMMGDTILINLGSNGLCPDNCQKKIIEKTKDKEVFWVNVTNNNSVHVNEIIEQMANENNNIHIIDWNSFSFGHSEYFIADGIHLTVEGRKAYANYIYDSIYDYYIKDLNAEKESAISKHNEKINNRISFIGNDLLLNAYELLSKKYENASFTMDKSYTFDKLVNDISSLIDKNELNNKVIILLDNNFNLSEDEVNIIKELCNNHLIYIISLSKNNLIISENYYNIYNDISDLLMADKLHLSIEGNNKLIQILEEIIN